MTFRCKSYRSSAAFTLVELLVALTIASVITLIALPAIRNSIKQHASTRSAEVVRQVFINARAQAIKSNRPFGVVLHRNNSTGEYADFCRSLSFVAAPPAYQGDIATARTFRRPRLTGDARDELRFVFPTASCARLFFEVDTYLNGSLQAKRKVTMGPGAVLFLDDLVGPFEVLEVSTGTYRYYNNSSDVSQTTSVAGVELKVRPVSASEPGGFLGDTSVYNEPITPPPGVPVPTDSSADSPLNDWSREFRFEILGTPIESFLPSVELPKESCVDLSISGVGLGGVQFNSQNIRCTTSVDADTPASENGFERMIIMFGPTGDIQRIYGEGWNSAVSGYLVQNTFISGTIYLAVGRTDGIYAPETAVTFNTQDDWRGTLPNYASSDTVWLSLRSSSGAISLSPQSAATQPAVNFYTQNSIGPPSTGTLCADRAQQMTVLGLRVAEGRQLAKQGARIP